jgi:hypothetical protein
MYSCSGVRVMHTAAGDGTARVLVFCISYLVAAVPCCWVGRGRVGKGRLEVSLQSAMFPPWFVV